MFYNLTITGLSVAVALVIGTIELGGLLSSQLDLSGPSGNSFENVDINVLGFVIVAMFVATWVIALVKRHPPIPRLKRTRPEIASGDGGSAPGSVVAMLRFQATLLSDTRRRVYLPLPGEPRRRDRQR